MHKDLLSAAVAAFLLLSGDAFARQNAQGQPSQNQAQQSQQSQQAPPSSASQASAPAAAPAPSSQSTVVSPPPHEDSLVAAARKAREQKKDQAGAKPPRVFNNDNIPTAGGVSAVGQNPPETDGTDAATGAAAAPAPAAGTSAGSDEKTWRKRFADLRRCLLEVRVGENSHGGATWHHFARMTSRATRCPSRASPSAARSAAARRRGS